MWVAGASDAALVFPATAEQARGKKQQSADESEDCAYRDANEPQRQRQKPDYWEKHQRQQRHGPAQHQKHAPANEEDQRFHEA